MNPSVPTPDIFTQQTPLYELEPRPQKVCRQFSIGDVTIPTHRFGQSIGDSDSSLVSSGLIEPEDLDGLPPCEDPDQNDSKRKHSISGYDRINHSRLAPPLPIYDVRSSVKTPGEPKAHEWRTAAARMKFQAADCYRLAQWGVKKTHRGTCVLVPEDWRNLDPMLLRNLFDLESCPSGQARRLRYHYANHGTAYARALAWFAKPKRSGVELDNFVGDGPYQQMEASHTCHHDACIIHITYEAAHINHDRKKCCLRARRLRQEGEDVPEHCDDHNSPCLLQHAALATNEVYSIQFDVLRQARRLPTDLNPFRRPRRHQFSTFEGYLPCRFTAVKVHPDDLEFDCPVSRRKSCKPDLFCKFCKRIRAFDSLAGFWGHVVHKHDGIEIPKRLEEIRRTATEWRIYSEQQEGGKKGQSTLKRIEQALRADFDWEIVLAWELR
ncbi:MAG: hypothetical protein Q9213_005460 [Squamulea squamosa]